jgi:hypothetical protein
MSKLLEIILLAKINSDDFLFIISLWLFPTRVSRVAQKNSSFDTTKVLVDLLCLTLYTKLVSYMTSLLVLTFNGVNFFVKYEFTTID